MTGGELAARTLAEPGSLTACGVRHVHVRTRLPEPTTARVSRVLAKMHGLDLTTSPERRTRRSTEQKQVAVPEKRVRVTADTESLKEVSPPGDDGRTRPQSWPERASRGQSVRLGGSVSVREAGPAVAPSVPRRRVTVCRVGEVAKGARGLWV